MISTYSGDDLPCSPEQINALELQLCVVSGDGRACVRSLSACPPSVIPCSCVDGLLEVTGSELLVLHGTAAAMLTCAVMLRGWSGSGRRVLNSPITHVADSGRMLRQLTCSPATQQ